jgi:hypothetical protein
MREVVSLNDGYERSRRCVRNSSGEKIDNDWEKSNAAERKTE